MKTLTLVFIGALSALVSGCGAAENAIDCHGICTRYQTCYDKDYDTKTCETRCRANANSDQDFMSKTDTCSNCLGAKDCASATFNCPSCIGIVP